MNVAAQPDPCSLAAATSTTAVPASPAWCRALAHDATHLFAGETYTLDAKVGLVGVCGAMIGAHPVTEEEGDQRCDDCRRSAAARALLDGFDYFDRWRQGRTYRDLR